MTLESSRTQLPRVVGLRPWALPPPSPRACFRSYHSLDLNPPPISSSAQSAILAAASAHVPECGFTSRAISLGLRDAGYPAVSRNLLSRGPFDLVHYHLVNQRRALAAAKDDLNPMLEPWAKARAILLRRLLANTPVIRHWQDALALMAQLTFAPAALSELFKLSDDVLHLSGDCSTDTSWYTRRATLAAIYASTELFMTRDYSPNFTDTAEFLDRQLKEADLAGETLSGVGDWIGFAAQASINVLRSKGIRL